MQNLKQLIASHRLAGFLLGLWILPGILTPQTARLALNGIFTENVVLQRDADLPVYGTADEGERVTVVCSSPEVEQPVAVRYAWANFPLCNLFNKDGLPAGPFRSDDFEMGAAGLADRIINAEIKQKEGIAK